MDPSNEDIDTTNKITQALKYVDVPVLGHIMYGAYRRTSLALRRWKLWKTVK